MPDAASYSATDQMRDGRVIEIRALKPTDEADMLAAVERIGAQSLYRRFMGAKRGFSDKERAFFLNVDFVNHVALVAVVKEQDRASIIAGGRFIVEKPGTAEVAFAVVDDYQGQGIGASLLRHLAILARQIGLKEFTAEVLPDNTPMLKVFERSGLKFTSRRSADGVHAVMQL
ncbi:MAG TPA: GNAT family N-acetyltransferase [Pseudolabrys sp.]|jgi:GNAT superfamily N-acetyltransferase|nr:GNAT family N-acetyltransferase [Pseudolabrys sp.]